MVKTWDKNKEITYILYDDWGNVKTVQFREGGQIEYVYTADGEKLKKRVKTSTVPLSRTYGVFDTNQATLVQVDSTIYIGGLVLEQGESPKVLFHGGYATLDHTAQGGGTGLSSLLPTCHYYLTDHQGNVRMVVREDGTLEQINQYFPYGVPIHGHMGSGVQPYKYNGKELDRMHGLDLYDYGARQYDPTLGRFTTRDPMWEKYYHLSPYAYCGGDPVNFVDPTGMIIDLSHLSDEERERYNNDVKGVREYSALFNCLYESLEQSENVYYVKYSTIKSSTNSDIEIPGHFIPTHSSGGLIEFSNTFKNINPTVLAEEFFHAYQHDNRSNYGPGEFNREFEAKVYSTLVGRDCGGIMNSQPIQEFQNNLISYNKYGNDDCIIFPENVIGEKFLNEYFMYAEKFRQYNILNGIGNKKYKMKTETKPYSLQKIVLDTYNNYY